MSYKSVPGFELQESPRVYVAGVVGKWLLQHSTPSWRSTDPIKGFQRIVREERARKIAVSVLNQRRTFPNAIILATDVKEIPSGNGVLKLPSEVKFLVVDGQHRMWAQKFSEYEPTYACIIHAGLSEIDMAKLFLEINDNQKRVPASLRWDLVRLVRPESDPAGILATDLIYELATDESSPLFQRIDLTGEQGEILVKQATLAPEIKLLVSSRKQGFKEADYDDQYEVLRNYFTAISSLDRPGWRSGKSVFTGARVMRALIKVLPAVAAAIDKPLNRITPQLFRSYLSKIDDSSLSTDNLRAVQGTAGIRQITDTLIEQMEL